MAADLPHDTTPIGRALDELRQGLTERFAAAESEQALRDENAKILGKKGELTAILNGLGKVPPDQRKAIGQQVNGVKQEVEASFAEHLGALRKKERRAELDAPPFDLTLPARMPVSDGGHRHPISRVREEVVSVFRQLGFAVFDGPEVEHEENNFGLLGYPPDHPATDMQDTFWTNVSAGGSAGLSAGLSGVDKKLLLRSHTSNIQIRAMKSMKPPMAFMAPGTVYRRDDDATHSPMFHQIEAFLIDKNITLAHLKGVLAEFAERIYGPNTPVRLRGRRWLCILQAVGRHPYRLQPLQAHRVHRDPRLRHDPPRRPRELRDRSRRVVRVRARHGARANRDPQVRDPEHQAALRERSPLPRSVLSARLSA